MVRRFFSSRYYYYYYHFLIIFLCIYIYVNIIFINKGQNYLTDLKDKISCVKSEIKVGEFSQDPDQVKQAPRLGV